MPLDPAKAWHGYQPIPEIDPTFRCPECGCEQGTVVTQPDQTFDGRTRVTVTSWRGACGHNILIKAVTQPERRTQCPGGTSPRT